MQTIGERLEEARKRKGMSIREAAEATKIRGDYLHKFESNQFDIKLPDIYIRGFLRIYCHLLKLPGEKIVSDYLSLGLGEGGRPSGRGVGREIYGRMDISHTGTTAKVGTAAKSATQAIHSHAPTGEATAVTTAQRAPFQPRMPLGGLDRSILSKNGLWVGVGAAALLALVVWGLVALLGGSSPTPSANNPGQETRPAADTGPVPILANEAESIYLVALRSVQITAIKARADGRELAPPVALAANQR